MGNWFRDLGKKIADGFRKFMQGRYGSDKLNTALLITGILCSLLSTLSGGGLLSLVLSILAYILLGYVIFRMLSRDTYRRYQENRKYLQFLDRFKDKEHRYFDCPRCRQPVRVPRGKGKIAITCPKCKEKFIKKT